MKPLYIVAVSGGVDSVVLLHQLVEADGAHLVVAHVDHGIRPESGEDAQFVRRIANEYELPFELISLGLGAEASEERAREGRWQFLRELKEKYSASKIVTAHHGDDVVETMVINLTRGTGWRGIASLRETSEIKRPLIEMRKRQIIEYAREHALSWHEDATNQDDSYLRNRIRHTIMPLCSDQQFATFMDIYKKQLDVREGIEGEVSALSPALLRYDYIMWPDAVAREMLRACIGALTRREIDQALLFVRTARPSKQLPLSNDKVLKVGVKQFIVSGGQDC